MLVQDRLKARLYDLRLATGLLTRLPVHVDYLRAEGRNAEIVWAFPFIGVLIGGLGGGLMLTLIVLGVTPVFAAVIGVALQVLLTGAMHEDGVADTADGLGPLATRERRLEIMRDSRIGAFGTLALILVLLARVTGLAALDGWILFIGPIAAGAMSRAAMVWVGFRMPQARRDGMAAKLGRPGQRMTIVTLAIGLGFCVLAAGLSGILVAAIALLATVPIMFAARKTIGGQTGDILGAAQQCAEIAVLGALIALT